MRKELIILIVATLFCCKGETKKEVDQGNSKSGSETPNFFKNAEKSTVTINMGGTEYSSPCNCSYFGKDYFYFKSDKLETTDTNGDGIVINGHQQDDKMILTLIIHGKYHSAANLNIEKKEFTAIGAGKLFSEDGSESFNTTYKVSCK